MAKRLVASRRTRIEKRARNRCEYCHAPQSVCGYRFHLEHIVPVAQGGLDGDENRALACAACNLTKRDMTQAIDPESGKMSRLFNPRSDRWDEHFGWDEESQRLLGFSVIGRATVNALSLNDSMRLEARMFWVECGLFP